MGFGTCELMPDKNGKDGHTYKVVVETGPHGYGRLNVAYLKPDSDQEENSQGVDLTASECRALAKMLNATADLVETLPAED